MTRNKALARLGLAAAATAEEIKHAYRKLAFELHPDLHPENPNAGKEFQLLNEAYVFLTSAPTENGAPRTQTRAQARAQAQAEATERARADAHRAYERAKRKLQEEQNAGFKKAPDTKKQPADGKQPEAEKTREMKREEVLQDLLRDPFARRVFEDIYTQIQEEAVRKQNGRGKKPAAFAEPGLLERTAGGVSDWFRRQIDEEQTVRVAGPLTPGKRLRLQVHQGVFGKSQTLELMLPPGFEPDRPIRLKGLGKRIGKWQGDLYLRIIN